MEVSFPMQSMLSKKIMPTPGPKKAAWSPMAPGEIGGRGGGEKERKGEREAK